MVFVRQRRRKRRRKGNKRMTNEEFYRVLDDLYEKGNQDEVRRFLEEQLKILDASGGTDEENRLAVAVCNEAGSYYRGRNEWNACLPLYDKLLMKLREMGLAESEPYAIALMNRATAYRFMGKLDVAEADFSASEKLLVQSGNGNFYALAGLYNNHAAVAAELGEYEKAIRMFQTALSSLAGHPGTEAEQALSLSGIAQMYMQLGDVKKAFEYADEALKLMPDPASHPHGGAVLAAKAHCCYCLGDHKTAAELFLRSAEITKRYFGENHEYRSCMENYRKAESRA